MCMIDECDERVTVLASQHRAARKGHKCSECCRVISRGEKYLNEKCLFDSRVTTHKTCRHCQVVREWLLKECGDFVYEAISEDIREHAWEGYGVAVKLMAAGMDRRWTRKDGKPWRLPRLPKVTGHAQSAGV